MSKVFKVIRRELGEALPPTIFFFILFHFVVLTNHLILESYDLTPTRSIIATIGALIGGKAVLLANRFSFVNLFSDKPLIYNVLWRTVVYALCCCFFLVNEEIISNLIHHRSLHEAVNRLETEISPSILTAHFIWLFVALLLYNSFAALDRYLGEGTIRRLFLVDRMSQPHGDRLIRQVSE